MISFVYFDVGGVVILDFSGRSKWAELKQELGITQEKDAEFEEFWDRYGPEVDVGRDVESLIPLLKKKFGSKLPENYSFLIDGFVNRFKTNKSIWPVIEEIAKVCKVGLLTNQYPNMLEAIEKKGLMPSISWEVVIDSSEEHIRKPDKAIFGLAEKRTGFKGKEILFVENSAKHIKAAEEIGWNTFLYDPTSPADSSRNLINLFKKLVQ